MVGPATVHADPLGLLVAFGAGMLSFLSPCVLPLVPAYLSMVSGLSAAELAELRPAPVPVAVPAGVGSGTGTSTPSPHTVVPPDDRPDADAVRRQRARLLRGIIAFIAGFTLIFTILGASASAIGRLFLTHQRFLETVSGVLIVVFGAVLMAMAAGLALPPLLSGERRLKVRPSALGAWAPPVMGMAFAFAWTPCIGPVLGSVLALAAGTGGTAVGGVALLLAYSLGIGVPFLVSGLAFGRLTDALARVRTWLRLVDLAGGAVLVAFGLLLLTGHVGVVSGYIADWLRDLHLSRLSTS
ncbi:MAG TPA: cytochrome c biogenesis protein CcdA [Acidimicrobiales bacterium]|jgi:cytochrome c-type biogenesis protein|nr:cytochrome c biogenesis protein CcdA [Acidimicrobiales bacterium]